MNQSLEMFLVICLVMTITPGIDTVLVIQKSITDGILGTIASTCGICSGLLLHATLSSLGLSIILQQSEIAFQFVKYLGAAYLLFLGLKCLYQARRFKNSFLKPDKTKIKSGTFWIHFRDGFLTNILNPKVAIFYLTLIPQFIDTSKNTLTQSLGLALIHIFMSFLWLFIIGRFVQVFRSFLEQSKVQKSLETLSGLILIAFALKIALQTH